jgi:hypothetical protein
MFDISYLFQFKKDLDFNLLRSTLHRTNFDDFKKVWLRFNQIIEFWQRHDNFSSGQIGYLRECKRYVITYGFIFLNNLNSSSVDSTADCSWIVSLFDYVHSNLSERLKQKLITITEHSLLKNKEIKSNLIFSFISHPIFFNRYFNRSMEMNSTQYELATLISCMICPQNSFLEGTNPDATEIQRRALNDSTDLFLFLYKQEPEKIIDFFTLFVVSNQSKTQVHQQTYYNDKINTYNFLMNMMVIVKRIYACMYEFDGNYEPVVMLNDGKLESAIDPVPNKIKLYWLVFEFFRITYYSLLLQNNNSAIQIALNPDLAFSYKVYIDANNRYLKNKIYFEVVLDYMYDLIASDTFDCIDEEKMMEILLFWENLIETNANLSSVCKKIVFRSACNLFLHKEITNPHLSIKVIKIVYLLQKFYNINASDLLSNEFNQFNELLCNFYVRIDKLSGLDEMTEKFYYKTNILEIIIKNELPIHNKHFVNVIFKDVKNTLEYLIATSMGHEKLNAAAYNVYKNSMINFLSRLNLRINFINLLIVEKSAIFKDMDIKYQLIKYVYGILKNCYDERSSQVKVWRTKPGTNQPHMEIWTLFIENVIIPFSKSLNDVIQMDQIADMIHRFYGDLLLYFKRMDDDLFTEFRVIFDIKWESATCAEYPDNLPEEFMDPVLFTPVKQPVLLPGSRLIMDSTVIEAHLLENEMDPFTRQPLTLAQLHEFNEQEDAHKLCMAFIQKRDEWINTNHCPKCNSPPI